MSKLKDRSNRNTGREEGHHNIGGWCGQVITESPAYERRVAKGCRRYLMQFLIL